MTRPTRSTILAAPDTASWRFETATSVVAPAGAESLVALVRRAQDGDASAFERLAADRIDGAYRLAVAILRSEADARDAVQEAFVAAWHELPRLREPDRFERWLDRIVVNACRMAMRHRRVVRIRELELTPGTGESTSTRGTSAEPALDDLVSDADLMRRALGRLTVDQRTVLVLHHAEDRPVAEIAAVMGVPAGTVKWRLHRAREALRRAVEEEAPA